MIKEKIPLDVLTLANKFEIIKPVINGRNRYFISNQGRIFSYYRNKVKILKQQTNFKYKIICLSFDNKKFFRRIHRLILGAFVGPCPINKEVRHLDNNPANNNLDNLCYGTRKENKQDSIKAGTSAKETKHGSAKLTENQIKEIRKKHNIDKISCKKLVIKYKISERQIFYIINNQCWGWLS